MRINKILSNLGYCSRKDANKWIEEGRLTVNGEPCITGKWIRETDVLLLDGQPLVMKPRIYLLLNKPVGITCTADSTVEDNIVAFLNYPEYIFPVGRLDKESQGLMLMTNDGELANQLLDGEHGHEKEYRVMVDRPIEAGFMDQLADGIELDSKMTKPCETEQLNETEFRIVLSQGLNRQIRRMCLVCGYKVVRLERIRIMNLKIAGLSLGQWRHLLEEELQRLKDALRMELLTVPTADQFIKGE